MKVKEVVENTVCESQSLSIFRRKSTAHDERTLSGWMKNRELVRMVWSSAEPGEECPPLDGKTADSEIEDSIVILPFTGTFAVTIKA